MDQNLMRAKSWTVEYAGGTVLDRPVHYNLSRLRHGLGRRVLARRPQSAMLQQWAIARSAPDLAASAMRRRAELYIAHHPSVLPIAIAAAKRYGAPVGYDAEDFYSGMYRNKPTEIDRLIERVEHEHLPRCSYVTAASPGIADAYVKKYGIHRPTVILNVFPLSERPSGFTNTAAPGDPLRVYWFSQCIGTHRGLEDVVGALKLLRDCAIEFHVRGEWQTGYRKQFFECVESAGIPLSRIIAHPPAPSNTMVKLAAQYDIGLALEPHSSENSQLCLSNKIFTYFLAGCAVIGTATKGQLPFLQSAGHAACTYAAGDVSSLAQRIRFWYENKNCLREARKQAWRLGELKHNWDLEKVEFLSMIRGVRSPEDLSSMRAVGAS
jgi:hypothetical protein